MKGEYPPITVELIYQHIQANQAKHFLRVSWKDGIDIEEPSHSVEYLLHAYADAARESWASLNTLRAQLAEAQRDAERWSRAAHCARLDQFGGFVVTPDEPAFASDVSLAFTREIDVAIDAAKGEKNGA